MSSTTTNNNLRHWQLTADGLQHLSLGESPIPQPGPRQILVRVEAASLNYRDLMLAEGRYLKAASHPYVPASDMAGIVQAVGSEVRRWRGGERVVASFLTNWISGSAPEQSESLGMPGPGMLATHVLVDEDWLVAAPTHLSAAQAATLPCAAVTAWHALIEQGGLQSGQTVLVHGTGGVALFGVQFALMQGAQVIVVTGSQDKREQVARLGAQHVLDRQADWPAEVQRITEGRGVNHVLETVGGSNLAASLQVIANDGTVSFIGVQDGADIAGSAFDIIRRRAVIRGISVGPRSSLESMAQAIDAARLQPVIAAEYGFDDAPQAFAHLQRGPFGKVVIRM